MRDVPNRQLSLLFAALLVSCAIARAADEDAAADLRAVKLREAALASGRGDAAGWKKLGTDYACLVKKHPRDLATRDAYGDYLLGMNDRDGAMQQWLAAEKIDPGNFAILDHLAGTYLAMGEPKTSLGYYIRASDARPADAQTHFNAANVACMFRHDLGTSEGEAFALALRHFSEAHRLAPKSADYARAYAETFYLIDKPDWLAALKIWTDYLDLVPEKNFALLNLARVQMKLGHADEARACLSQVKGTENERLRARLSARIDAEFPPDGKAPSISPKPGIDEAGRVP